MSSTPHEPSSGEERVNEVIAAYLQAIERGGIPDQEKLLADHPDIAAELKSFFANRECFQQAAGELVQRPASDTDEPTLTLDEWGVPPPKDVIRYFGDYELLEEIARGGMGVVFKARQVTLNRIVAVKMILSGLLASPEDVERFHTEAEAAAKLDHPGIVPIYEVGQHEGQHYFSMGFVDGQSLSARVAQGPLPAREAAELVRTVAEAVQYAHNKGVIHRDLKPGNVLLDQQGNPRITDFGLAKLTESHSDLTGTGQILGTPGYMPPEQAAAQAGAVGKLSDIYSLGAILYSLLTGRPPFQAANPLETLLQVQKQDPVPPERLNPNIPLDLDTIVLKCLDKAPSRRYASARALAEELQRYLAGRPILARPVGRLEYFWRWCRREPVIASLSAAVAVALIVGSIVSGYYGVLASNRAEGMAKLAEEKGKLAESEIKAKTKIQEQMRIAQEQLQQSVHAAVDAVQNNRGATVPDTLAILKTLPGEMVLSELKSRYAVAETNQKLRLAFALADYGEVDAVFLCSQIKQSAPEEADNFVTAFGHDRDASLKEIEALAAQCHAEQRRSVLQKKIKIDYNEVHAEQELRLKSRMAVIALHLGDDQIAVDMCRIDDRPDPVQRTIFVDEFPIWHGNLAKLVARCEKLSSPALRSAICMSVASIAVDRLAIAEAAAWKLVICEWYQTAPDKVTHSAAGWALRQWKCNPPAISPTEKPDQGREWFVNSVGMTMLKFQPGQFVRSGPDGNANHLYRDDRANFVTKLQTVKLSGEFFLADCETSTYLFRQSLNSPGEPIEETPVIPTEHVSWFDAVLFCNWLSYCEQLEPCYERTGKKIRLPPRGASYDAIEYDNWQLSVKGTGYRLPTEAEWEYACRAGTTTNFSSGTDVELLRKYATYSTGNNQGPALCGSKLPNGWGLFDMHGNVPEWCHDWFAPYGQTDVNDPTGVFDERSLQPMRVFRGGSWNDVSFICRSASRSSMYPDYVRTGFRVARSSVP
jgi:serine/threonine protein kinase/formylglycine-generating enzyme required for sulfatase activity